MILPRSFPAMVFFTFVPIATVTNFRAIAPAVRDFELVAVIDGVRWPPDTGFAKMTADLYEEGHTLVINVLRRDSVKRGSFTPYEVLTLTVPGVTTTGTYALSGTGAISATGATRRATFLRSMGGFRMAPYTTRDTSGGVLTVTEMNPNTRTLRGTFTFTGRLAQLLGLFNGPLPETVTVTDGRFAGRYNALTGPYHPPKPSGISCPGGGCRPRSRN